jgi:hypothetical protein
MASTHDDDHLGEPQTLLAFVARASHRARPPNAAQGHAVRRLGAREGRRGAVRSADRRGPSEVAQ